MNEQKSERDQIVKELAYEFVRFNHDPRQAYLVTDVTDDCMLELEGMAGLFDPCLFQRVNDIPPQAITTTNIPESQPVDEGGAPWRDAGGHAWDRHVAVECVECPYCGFIFAAIHTDGDSDGYSCPNCESRPEDSSRTPSPDSIREKAERVALKLKRDADDMFAMPVDDEPIVTQWADIIAAEFGAGENNS